METWKDIEDYTGHYQISNKGNIRSLDRTVRNVVGYDRFYKGQIIRPSVNGSGYLQVGLSKDGCKYMAFVHKLVAQAFIPNVRELKEVNHIDHNKLNCKVENLEWCTRQENMVSMAEFYGIKADINYCIDCEKEIRKSSIRCISCSNKINSNNGTEELLIRIGSLDEFKNKIKSEPFTKIAKSYGVSDNAIRKWCKRLNLPYKREDIKNYNFSQD